MLSNSALISGQTAITASGTTTIGFAPGNTAPKDFITVSAAGAATLALAPINLTGTTLGIGGNQLIRVMNLAAQSVVFSSTDTFVGTAAATTIAANACATLISNASNSTWYRF